MIEAMKVSQKFVVLGVVLAIPVLLAVASQALTRPAGDPVVPTSPIVVPVDPPVTSDGETASPAPVATSAAPATAEPAPAASAPVAPTDPSPTDTDADSEVDDD